MRKYINIWREMVGILRDFIATPHFKKIFIYGIVFYGIALFALTRGDIYYIDDLFTSAMDITWNHNSRYLATFILNDFTAFGKGAVDSSPLLQIMGVCLAVISSLILLYLICKKFDLLGVLASLPLGLSPHFLQNFSYKFESLFMCVALFCAILPFLFKENKRVFCVVSVVCLIAMFMTYQAANGTYIILSLYFAFSLYFLEQRSFKESAIFLAICAMNLIMASLFYKIIIVQPINEYVVQYASDKMIPLDSLFIGICANLSAYLTTIFNDLKQTPYICLIALIATLFVINTAIRTNRNKIATIFATIAFLLLGICLSYGLYLVLQKPLFEPRAFYGFNAFIAVLCIATITHSAPPNLQKILHYISCVAVVVMAYFLISFANIYGNALKKQDEYLDFRGQLLISDLANVLPKNATITIDISRIGNAKVTQRFYDKYGILSLIPRLAKQDDALFIAKLRHLQVPYNLGNTELCNFMMENFDKEMVFQNTYHRIEKVKSCYIVTLN